MTRVGLVLGGGGMTGTAFHAGVVGALAHVGWDARAAEVMIGTSAGSTSAALLRAGFPPTDYVPRMTGEPVSPEGAKVLDRIGRVPAAPPRARGPLRPAAPALLRRSLRHPARYPLGVTAAALLPAGTVPIDTVSPGFGSLFEHWPDRPTWITAVRLDTGERVIFGRDSRTSLPDAVRASCSIPGYFRPVMIDGVPHVDGGAWSVHHADLLAAQDLDLVVVSAPLSTSSIGAPVLDAIPRLPIRRQLAREVRELERAGTPVLVVAPDRRLGALMGVNSMDITKRPVVAESARALTVRRLSQEPELTRLLTG